jgi:hypothetical protein
MANFVIFESGNEKSEGQQIAINPDHVAAVHRCGRWTKAGFKEDSGYNLLLVGPPDHACVAVLHDGDLASLIDRLRFGSVPAEPPRS